MYILEYTGEKINDKILRLDLFRLLNKEENHWVFTGGLFRILKHYSIPEHLALSINKKGYIVQFWDSIINQLLYCFFFKNFSIVPNEKDKFEVEHMLDDEHLLYVKFHYQKEAKVYFLDSMHLKKLKKRKI